MLDKRRFRVLMDFKVYKPGGSSILIKANRSEADVWAYVPLTDPVVVLIEGEEYRVPRPIFESRTEPWDVRGATA